jgi:hypothetical protein
MRRLRGCVRVSLSTWIQERWAIHGSFRVVHLLLLWRGTIPPNVQEKMPIVKIRTYTHVGNKPNIYIRAHSDQRPSQPTAGSGASATLTNTFTPLTQTHTVFDRGLFGLQPEGALLSTLAASSEELATQECAHNRVSSPSHLSRPDGLDRAYAEVTLWRNPGTKPSPSSPLIFMGR